MNNLSQHLKRFWNRNGATVLTCTGAAGVVVTSVMAVKATSKATAAIEQAKAEKGEDLTKLEVVRAAGPAYIPTIIIGASTMVCIFGANILNKQHQASIAGAYALLDNSYKEYKKKVEELYGKDGANEVKTAIAKDKFEVADLSLSPDMQLFYDEFTGQYFESTIERVLRAESEINRNIHLSGFAYLVDFYDAIGYEYDDGSVLGWSEGGNLARYWQSWVDFGHHKVELEDGLECIILTIFHEPYMEFE